MRKRYFLRIGSGVGLAQDFAGDQRNVRRFSIGYVDDATIVAIVLRSVVRRAGPDASTATGQATQPDYTRSTT